MKKKKILWVSRHVLWGGQIYLLKKTFGRRVHIQQVNLRFENLEHFLDFLNQKRKEFILFAVVPKKWKEEAAKKGFLVGTIDRPKIKKNNGRKKTRIFCLSYGPIKKCLKKSYGSKGFYKKI